MGCGPGSSDEGASSSATPLAVTITKADIDAVPDGQVLRLPSQGASFEFDVKTGPIDLDRVSFEGARSSLRELLVAAGVSAARLEWSRTNGFRLSPSEEPGSVEQKAGSVHLAQLKLCSDLRSMVYWEVDAGGHVSKVTLMYCAD